VREARRTGPSRWSRWVLALATLALTSCAGGGHRGAVTPPTSSLPVLRSAGQTPSAGDLGDPSLLTVPAGPTGPGRYVLFGTGDWPSNVPTAVSSDLKSWRPGADALPVVPAWSKTGRYHSRIWAPAVSAVGSRWLLYITVPDRVSGRQCIAVAASGRPEGPYRDAIGHPLVCQSSLGGSIDPAIARGDAGMTLLWKSDGNCCGLQPYRASVPGQRSPGGLDVFRDLDGRLRAVFDTWTRPPRDGRYYCCRAIDLAEVTGL